MKGHYLFNDDLFDFADKTVKQSNSKTIKQQNKIAENTQYQEQKKGLQKSLFKFHN